MTDVFVSYAREDSDRVLAFAEGLRRTGRRVWIDQTDILTSVPWREEVEKGIRSATLVAVMYSGYWHDSENCWQEYRKALQLKQPILRIDVTGDTQEWVRTVECFEKQLAPKQRARALLLVSSYRWMLAGRPRSLLASGRMLRDLRLALYDTDDQLAAEYIRHSIKRSRRQLLAKLLVALLILTFVVGRRVAEWVGSNMQRRLEDAVKDPSINTRTDTMLLKRAPSLGIEKAISVAEASDSWPARAGLLTALSVEVPSKVTGSCLSPSRISVLPRGHSLKSEHGVLSVTKNGIQVEDPNKTTAPIGSVTALSWAPDGSAFAAAAQDGVHVYASDTMRELHILRGCDGAIGSLKWTETTLEGASGKARVSWSMAGNRTIAKTSWRIEGFSKSKSASVLVWGISGQLAVLDGSTSLRKLDTVAESDRPLVVEPFGRGWVLATSTANDGRLQFIDQRGLATDSIALSGCAPVTAATSDKDIYVGCAKKRVIRVSNKRESVKRLAPTGFQISALVVDASGQLLASSVSGGMYTLKDGSWARVGSRFRGCMRGNVVTAKSPDGNRVVSTGDNVSAMCTLIRFDPSNLDRWDRLASPTEIKSVRATDWSADGRTLVFAAASGQLWVLDTDLLIGPTISVSGGELVAATFTGPGEVLVASHEGRLIQVDVSTWTASKPEQLKLARKRLAVARDANLDR